jgi:hypothetical protein
MFFKKIKKAKFLMTTVPWGQGSTSAVGLADTSLSQPKFGVANWLNLRSHNGKEEKLNCAF